eukprot:GHUV01029074.1.p1 GENE.GHUV01029074.1~~GHUV01029074.1.p1  ORF type:complete len:127 (-),score=26.16 GHUV01029074.1:845-1225(-)
MQSLEGASKPSGVTVCALPFVEPHTACTPSHSLLVYYACCRLLSGRANLPPAAEMQSGIDAYYKRLQHDGIDLRYAHMMGDDQWRYNDWLAQAAGPDVKGLPSWRLAMYASAGANKRAYPDGYRDR